MLKPDSAQPGLWVNDAWTPGSAGTFAVIIGVSRYRNLDGSPTCFGLGQLYVSALTAFGLFSWLQNQYLLTGCPLAKCWLLLSPTAEEITREPGINAHVAEPTFGNCAKAIQQWKLEMERLPAEAAGKSRSVFFFSGHGLEVIEDRQILLPSDYLDPGTPIDQALSTQNISRGLKALRIPLHFLFVDACRNDHNNLGRYAPLEGTRVLDEPTSPAVNPDSFVPIFYASAAGTQAFQPNDTRIGVSLFGEALLDGLNARGLDPDCSKGKCFIYLHGLRPFVGDRIKEIVRDRYHETSSQRVRVRGDQTEEPVTELPPRPPSGAPFDEWFPFESVRNMRGALISREAAAVFPTTADFSTAHEFFGSEQITELWMKKARVFDYRAMEWLPKGSDIQVADLERSEDNTALRFNLTVPAAKPGHTYWLQIEDSVQAQAFVLPIDRMVRPPAFRVEMDFQFNPGVIKRFDVSLALESLRSKELSVLLGRADARRPAGLLDLAAQLWDLYNKESANEALRTVRRVLAGHANQLEEVLFYKVDSPLAAAIAGIVLLRAREWERLHDWLRNLANRFPEIPDGTVLWAEQCLRQPNSQYRQEALEYFLRLGSVSLPFLAEPTGFALRQAEDFLKGEVREADRDQIERIHKRLTRAVGMFRAGGLFATFAGPPAELNPFILTPTRTQGAMSAHTTA